MPNPGGGNQFGNFTIQSPYGDVQRQTQLQKESPISGAPFAAYALEIARRSCNQAKRGARQQPEPPPPAPVDVTGSAASPTFKVAAIWAQLARVPDASPLVQQDAARAAGQN